MTLPVFVSQSRIAPPPVPPTTRRRLAMNATHHRKFSPPVFSRVTVGCLVFVATSHASRVLLPRQTRTTFPSVERARPRMAGRGGKRNELRISPDFKL